MLCIGLFATPTYAQTTLPSGSMVYVFEDGPVTAQFIGGGSALFDNRLFLDDPTNSAGNIFFNHATSPGTGTVLGSFLAGAELLFRDNVSHSSIPTVDFFTGPASRNPDSLVHARVQMFTNAEVGIFEASLSLAPNTLLRGSASNPVVFLVGFEDILNEGDGDFNDMRFLLNNVTAVPEPSEAVLLLAGLGVIGLLVRRRRRL